MAKVRVYNITNRPQVPGTPRVVIVGPEKIRPGKSALVESRHLGTKVREMNGITIWIGALPRGLRQAVPTQAVPLDSAESAMTIAEVREYFEGLATEELFALSEWVVPSLSFKPSMPRVVLVARLSRALFMPDRVLDPEVFFWLRRWARQGDLYLEKEA